LLGSLAADGSGLLEKHQDPHRESWHAATVLTPLWVTPGAVCLGLGPRLFSRERPGPNWSRRGSESTCRSGIIRTAGYRGPGVDLAFTGSARDADPWQSGTAAGSSGGVDRDISEGFYFLHIPGLSISDRGLTPCRESRRTAPLRCFCRSGPRFRGPGFQGRFSWALFKARILRLNDRFPVQDAAGEALVTRASAN